MVESAPLPAEVAEAVDRRLRGAVRGVRRPPDLPVAVRSSATSEDSAEASFAGLQDTYLWVRGADSVLEHVRRCWASLYSVESVTYRLRRGIPETDLAMAVVVQRMVGARSSGVMFTRSPLTGDRSVVAIDASWGLGLGRRQRRRHPRLVRGQQGHRRDRPADRGDQDPLAPARSVAATAWSRPTCRPSCRTCPSLSDDEIAELVAIARQVEAHYGCPQDIEWAVARTAPPGRTSCLLQSRPETVWAEKDAARRQGAAPAARAFDHVLNLLGGKRPVGGLSRGADPRRRPRRPAGRSTPAAWTSCTWSWRT